MARGVSDESPCAGSGICQLGGLRQCRVRPRSASLTISSREASKTYFAHDLLADPSVRDLRISNDPIYQASRVYRVVPMERLLRDINLGSTTMSRYARPITSPHPYPQRCSNRRPRPTRKHSWRLRIPQPHGRRSPASKGAPALSSLCGNPRRRPSRRTYWVYRVAALTVTDSPHKRWPNLGMPDALPASDPVWRGRDRFVALCMACHRFNGDGEGDAGPDLATPMSPVDYFQPFAFKLFLRNPSAVRSWPAQKMPAFDEATLSDADLDAIVAWLTYKRRSAPPQKAKP